MSMPYPEKSGWSGDHRPGVLHLVHSLTGGGMERVLVAMLRATGRGDWHHTVVTQREAGPLAAELPGHTGCIPMQIDGLSVLAGWRVARIARRRGATLVHARGTGCWFDAITAKLCSPRLKLILGFHGCEVAEPLPPRVGALARWGVRLGAIMATVSEAGRGQLQAEADVPGDRVHVVPNGVDLQQFGPRSPTDRARIRKALGIDPNAFVIGTVGSLTAIKRHDLIIGAAAAAMRARHDTRLVVVGDGPQRGTLAALAEREGVIERTVFTGSRDDVAELLGAMDVYVCASIYECSSNAVLEALAAGLPVIATRVGGNVELLSHGTAGILVPPGSVSAIADAIARLQADAPVRQALGEAARASALRYGFERTVAGYKVLYASMLSNSASVRARNETSTPPRPPLPGTTCIALNP